MRKRARRAAALALVLGVWPWRVGLSQSADPGQTFVDRSDVQAVLVAVTVKDLKGRPVADLEQRDFRLYVDNLEFPVTSFWREAEMPLSLCLVVDVSGSMGGQRLAKVRESVVEFLARLRPSDEVSLITFGAGEVRRRVPFGTDPDLVRRTLESVEGFGTTALFDNLVTSPTAMDGARHSRRAILVFTDGVDTASAMTSAAALDVMQRLADPLYAFGIEPPPPAEPATETYEAVLARLAQASGGRYLRAGSAGELVGLARELRRELGTRYIITFQPSGEGQNKWRRIRVGVKGPYMVEAREGYVGTLP